MLLTSSLNDMEEEVIPGNIQEYNVEKEEMNCFTGVFASFHKRPLDVHHQQNGHTRMKIIDPVKNESNLVFKKSSTFNDKKKGHVKEDMLTVQKKKISYYIDD